MSGQAIGSHFKYMLHAAATPYQPLAIAVTKPLGDRKLVALFIKHNSPRFGMEFYIVKRLQENRILSKIVEFQTLERLVKAVNESGTEGKKY